jgi:hypothetical protein
MQCCFVEHASPSWGAAAGQDVSGPDGAQLDDSFTSCHAPATHVASVLPGQLPALAAEE